MAKKRLLNFRKLRLEDKQLETSIDVQTNTFAQRWSIKGLPIQEQSGRYSVFNLDTGAIKVPFLDERFNLKSSFDSIRLHVEDIDMDGDELHIDGFTSIANLKINHPKLPVKMLSSKMQNSNIISC